MRLRRLALLTVAACGAAWLAAAVPLAQSAPAAARKPGEYALGPDSLPKRGVPKGRLEGPKLFHSRIITAPSRGRGAAGPVYTTRKYWVYVPAQYDPATPANVLFWQDGQRAVNPEGPLRIPQVLENLIASKAIPVTIGIFVTPGQTGDEYPDTITNNPNNRANEYDAVNDTYARFVLEEMLPEVAKTYNLATDPARRAIGGTSSGAICAFTVAWNRPDQFRNVISMIGSYTSIGYRPARNGQPMVPGGDLYPTLIRRNPIKPLKVFLQDGSNDLNNQFGNWFLANQQMLSALEWANSNADNPGNNRPPVAGPRYQVNHEWGDGAHSDVHGGSILPDILRWIWNDQR